LLDLTLESAMNYRHQILTILLTFIAACAALAARAAETYDLDPSHMSIVFSCAHNKTSYTYGMFRQAKGRFTIDKTNPANCKFSLEIPVDSIDTNQPQRDTHLKSDTFFNAAQFPTITFDSTSVTQGGSTQGIVYQVTGNLTMHGVTKPVVLQIQLVGQGPDPSGREYHAGIMTQFALNRSDFGMDKLLPDLVGDAVSVTVSFEGKRIDDASAQGLQPPPR
jgi:polyisoprenoid-binding protein YceI